MFEGPSRALLLSALFLPMAAFGSWTENGVFSRASCSGVISGRDGESEDLGLREKIRGITNLPREPLQEFQALSSLFELRLHAGKPREKAILDQMTDEFVRRHVTLKTMLMQALVGLPVIGVGGAGGTEEAPDEPGKKSLRFEAERVLLLGCSVGRLRDHESGHRSGSIVPFLQSLHHSALTLQVEKDFKRRLARLAKNMRAGGEKDLAEALEAAPFERLLEMDGHESTPDRVDAEKGPFLIASDFQELISLFSKKNRLDNALLRKMDPRSFEFVDIPAGRYVVGVGSNRRTVILTQPFQIARTLWTQGLHYAVALKAPSFFHEIQSTDRPNQEFHLLPAPRPRKSILVNNPVTNISKIDFQRVLAELSKADPEWDYFIPTEAQGEVAALIGEDLDRLGHSNDALQFLRQSAHFREGDGPARPQRVGLKNATGAGIFDAFGNVWEFRADDYAIEPENGVDPVFLDAHSTRTLITGGSVSTPRKAKALQARLGVEPDQKGDHLGGRPLRIRKRFRR